MRILTSCLLMSVALAADPVAITVHANQPRQVITGIGFEIQSDSIGSGNRGLPEEPIAIPHDLVPSERERLAKEMLSGFRYCRLAGGLYWRGLDEEQQRLRPRWPEQLQDLKHVLDTAGVEGLSFEYWSPAPFWKSNRAYQGGTLRCFDKDFADDPVYRGDQTRFLADFARAVVDDIGTLQSAGLRVSMFGLQNEPNVGHGLYSTCRYPTPEAYVAAYRVVAGAIRQAYPAIQLFACTGHNFPKYIAPGMADPAVAALVDAYAVHIVGSPSTKPMQVHTEITAKLPPRPWFQNEYEDLTGGATPDRCLNTVEHLLNSFQLAGNPTWFWLHALKPFGNAEASGFALGFWRSRLHPEIEQTPSLPQRWHRGPFFTSLPPSLADLEVVTAPRRKGTDPGPSYEIIVNIPVTAYMVAPKASAKWTATTMVAAWKDGQDPVWSRSYRAGPIVVRATDPGTPPSALFLEPAGPGKLRVDIGLNSPAVIRSVYQAMERQAAAVEPGHWVTNPWNFHAVGSFAKRLPWDSTVLTTDEGPTLAKARHLVVRRPDGRLTVVVANRSADDPQTFRIATGITGGTWKGWRYTPDEAGPDTRGVPIGSVTGAILEPVLPPRSWEFWDQE